MAKLNSKIVSISDDADNEFAKNFPLKVFKKSKEPTFERANGNEDSIKGDLISEFSDCSLDISNQQVPSNADDQEIMELYDSKRKEAEQSTLLDLIAKKNDMVPTKDILKTHNFQAEMNLQQEEEEKEVSETTDSSGFFYDLPTPGPSHSELTMD